MNENPFKIQFHFQPEEVISAYTAVSTSMSQIINRIIESVEVGIFNLNDLNTVHQVKRNHISKTPMKFRDIIFFY